MKRRGNGKCGGGSGLADGDGLRIEIIRSFSEQGLRDIVAAYRKAMPWQFSDDADYFREMLHDKECVHVLLRKGGAPAGYLLAKPHAAAARDAELLEADPQFIPESDRYYIETMEIASELRNTLAGGKMFYRMLHAMFDEVKRRFGINRFSMHVRVGNGASSAVQRYFGDMITPIRRIENWKFYNGEDAADYLEGTYTGDGGKVSLIKRTRKEWADDEIYTPLEEAKEEVWRRWGNEALRHKVNGYVREVPEPLRKTPWSILDRTIITPNKELLYFLRVTKSTRVSNLCFEYLKDKLCSINSDKLSLVKMPFLRGHNKRGTPIIEYRKILDCTCADGQPCCEIETFWRDGLINFHRKLLSRTLSEIELFDMSAWFRSHGAKAQEYYKYFLALFICHGILFENFITTGEEGRFTETVVMPAYREVVSIFGVKPLIVQLLPPETADDDYWLSYPAELLEEVKKCLAKNLHRHCAHNNHRR